MAEYEHWLNPEGLGRRVDHLAAETRDGRRARDIIGAGLFADSAKQALGV